MSPEQVDNARVVDIWADTSDALQFADTAGKKWCVGFVGGELVKQEPAPGDSGLGTVVWIKDFATGKWHKNNHAPDAQKS